MQPWQIRLFGEMEAIRGEERVNRFGSRKNAALLALLAFKPGRTVLRESAMEALWPDVEPDAGRNRLSVALNALRKLLEPPGVPRGAVLVAEREGLRLDSQAVSSDVAAFEAALERVRPGDGRQRAAALDDALAWARGPLLPGAEEAWVEVESSRLEQRVVGAALERARLHALAGEGQASLELLLRAAAAAPTSLEIAENLLRTCLHLGRPGPGIVYFHGFESRYMEITGHATPRSLRRLLQELEALPSASRSEMPVPARKTGVGIAIRAWLDGQLPNLGEWPEVLDARSPAELGFARVTDALGTWEMAQSYDPGARMVVDVVEGGGGDLVGIRLLEVTPPGALFFSAPAAALYSRHPIEGQECRPLGTLSLAHVQEPVWAIVAKGMPTPTPGVRPHRRNGVPANTTRFWGREADLSAIQEGWQRGDRLRTLLGPGGIGKTRLAIEAARRWIADPEGPDEVAMVSLAELRGDMALETAIREAVGLVGPKQSLVPALVEHLGDRRILLVLDNAEHLVAGVARFVAEALHAVPGLQVLCTSQRPLRVEGEVRHPVLPFPLPENTTDLATLSDHSAVRLFVDRARAARPDFQLTPQNAASIVNICRQLEGSPLAIELAAARMGAWTPLQVLDRLGEGEQLTSRQRDRASRHRSLDAAIRWNAELLEPPLRDLWRELSIFSAPFDVELVEVVCGDPDAGDRLVELADAGLIVAMVGEDTPQWRWLETLRVFAAAELDPSRRQVLWQAYMDWTVDRSRLAYDAFVGANPSVGIGWFRHNWGHVRTGLSEGNVQVQVRLLLHARHFVERGGLHAEMAPFYREVMERVEELTEAEAMEFFATAVISAQHAGDAETAARVSDRMFAYLGRGEDDNRKGSLLSSLASARHYAGDLEIAERLSRRSMEIFQSLPRLYNVGVALENLSNILGDRGKLAEAKQYSDQALALYLEHGIQERMLPCRMYRALRALFADDPASARLELDAADGVFAAGDVPPWWVASEIARGQIALQENDLGLARRITEACVARFEGSQQARFYAFALQSLAQIDLADGRYSEALTHADRAGDLFRAQGVWIEVRFCLPTTSLAAVGLQDQALAQHRARQSLALALRMDAALGLPWMLFAFAAAETDGHAAARALAWADAVGRAAGAPLPRWMAGPLSRLWNRLPPPPQLSGSWQQYVEGLLR